MPNRAAAVNEVYLAQWLAMIAPKMEAELRKGCTNVFQFNHHSGADADAIQMFPYQTITLDGDEVGYLVRHPNYKGH